MFNRIICICDRIRQPFFSFRSAFSTALIATSTARIRIKVSHPMSANVSTSKWPPSMALPMIISAKSSDCWPERTILRVAAFNFDIRLDAERQKCMEEAWTAWYAAVPAIRAFVEFEWTTNETGAVLLPQSDHQVSHKTRHADILVEFADDHESWCYMGTECKNKRPAMRIGCDLKERSLLKRIALRNIGYVLGLSQFRPMQLMRKDWNMSNTVKVSTLCPCV